MNSVSVLQNIIMCLPQRHQRAVKCFLTEQKGAEDNISEIRLRHEGAFSLTIGNANVILNANGRTAAPGEKALTATPKELIETLDRLTEGSMHVFSQSLREGYLTLSNGCRVGVIGQAVCRGKQGRRSSKALRQPILSPGRASSRRKRKEGREIPCPLAFKTVFRSSA